MPKRVIQVVMVLLCVGTLASCAFMQPTRFVSGVDSLAHPDAAAKKQFIVLPGNKDVQPSDLQFLEYAGYIEKILTQKGLVKVMSGADADIAIFLSYGIGNPQTHLYSYSFPVVGQTGVLSSTTVGTATTYTPMYGVTGYASNVGTYTTYTRFLLMDAYDMAAFKRDQRIIQVWKTTVISTGSSNDLRHVFPYMAVAMKPFIGTNTGRKIDVEILGDDPQVTQLRGDINASPEKK